jgi:ribonucleoside-diphosphate reductase alpha chain
VNRYLVNELKARGLWTNAIRARLKLTEGSVQSLEELPSDVRAVYRTAWEVPMRSLIDMAADRGAFIDQSQSLNLFTENPSIEHLSNMYFYAWKKGLKTTYYLRSRPATRIAKATVDTASHGAPSAPRPQVDPGWAQVPSQGEERDTAAVGCSLENPESCEA